MDEGASQAVREKLVIAPLKGYEHAIGAALWRLQDARARTLRLLTGLPESALDRDVGGNTIGTVLYHVALIEVDWLYTEILQDDPPGPIAQLIAKLRGTSVAEFNRPRTLPDYDISPDWVIHHLAQHEAEHRGEIGSIIGRLGAGG